MMAGLVLAGVASVVGVGVGTSAQAATTPAASPVHPNAWYIKRVYASISTCKAAGQAYVDTNYAKAYKCLFDSPGVALWLDSF